MMMVVKRPPPIHTDSQRPFYPHLIIAPSTKLPFDFDRSAPGPAETFDAFVNQQRWGTKWNAEVR